MLKKRSVLALCGLVAACSGGPTKTEATNVSTSTQSPSVPKGTIAGRILDAATYKPLQGATVKVLGGPQVTTLTTDADGVIVLTGAAVQSWYSFVVSKDGYVVAEIQAAAAPANAGDYPLGEAAGRFTMGLYPADGVIDGVVFRPNGVPAAGAQVVVDHRALPSGFAGVTHEGVVTATADGDGVFRLTGLATAAAGVNHTVLALHYDENGDGKADFATVSVTGRAFPSAPGQPVPGRVFINYVKDSVPQRILWSNILDGEAGLAENLEFRFALPVRQENLNRLPENAYILTDTTRATSVVVPVTPIWDAADATKLALKPVSPLEAGHTYSLVLSLTTVDYTTGVGTGIAVNYSPPTLTFEARAPNSGTFAGQVQGLKVTNSAFSAADLTDKLMSDTDFDWNSNSFQLEWPAVDKAEKYRIYAKDSRFATQWGYVASSEVETVLGVVRATVTAANLPTNKWDLDATVRSSPLARGNTVSFKVVPLDVYGNYGDLATAEEASVRDNVAPLLTGVSLESPKAYYPSNLGVVMRPADAINESSTPSEIVLRVTFDEPMSDGTEPAIISTNAAFQSGGSVQTAFVWDPSTSTNAHGYLRLTLAAGADATGAFALRGGADQAGNPVRNVDKYYSLGGRREFLLAAAGTVGTLHFEAGGGNCASIEPSVHVASFDGGMPTTTVAVVDNSANSGTCAGLIGTIPGLMAPQVGYASLTLQTEKLPAILYPIGAGEAWSYETGLVARRVHYLPVAGTTPPTARQSCRLYKTTEASPPTAATGWTEVLRAGLPYFFTANNTTDGAYAGYPVTYVGGSYAYARSGYPIAQGDLDPPLASPRTPATFLRIVCDVLNDNPRRTTPPVTVTEPDTNLTNTAIYLDDVWVTGIKTYSGVATQL